MYTEKISTAELVGLLYKRAISNLERAINAPPQEALALVLHADEIVKELCRALDFASGGALAENLLKTYEFVRSRLLAAGTGGREKLVDEAKRALDVLQPLSEAWQLVVAEEAKRTKES
jgi:flagellin-specific chaperone FliS